MTSLHFIVNSFRGEERTTHKRLQEISNQLCRKGYTWSPQLSPLANNDVKELAIGPNHLAVLFRDGRVCRINITVLSETVAAKDDQSTKIKQPSDSSRTVSGSSNAGGTVGGSAAAAGSDANNGAGPTRGTKVRRIVMSTRGGRQAAGRILALGGRMIPASSVPEELIAQAQVVLQGKSREAIVRELQRTSLDVNQAVNNLLSREDDDGDDYEESAEGYLPEELMSLLDAGFGSGEHPTSLIIGDGSADLYPEDFISYQQLRRRQQAGKTDKRDNTSKETPVIQKAASGYQSPVVPGAELVFWDEKNEMRFSHIAATYSELCAVGQDGQLYQWRWKQDKPTLMKFDDSSPTFGHPRARSLNLVTDDKTEYIVSISASTHRVTILTASNQLASFVDECFGRNIATMLDCPLFSIPSTEPVILSGVKSTFLYSFAWSNSVNKDSSASAFWWGVIPPNYRYRMWEKTKAKQRKHVKFDMDELKEGCFVRMKSSPIYQAGMQAFCLINGIIKIGELQEDAFTLNETCRFKVKELSPLDMKHANEYIKEMIDSINKISDSPASPAPESSNQSVEERVDPARDSVSPIISTGSARIREMFSEFRRLSRKRTHTTSNDAISGAKGKEEAWNLDTVSFIDDQMAFANRGSSKIGEVMWLDGPICFVVFPDKDGKYPDKTSMDDVRKCARMLKREDVQIIKPGQLPRCPDEIQKEARKVILPPVSKKIFSVSNSHHGDVAVLLQDAHSKLQLITVDLYDKPLNPSSTLDIDEQAFCGSNPDTTLGLLKPLALPPISRYLHEPYLIRDGHGCLYSASSGAHPEHVAFNLPSISAYATGLHWRRPISSTRPAQNFASVVTVLFLTTPSLLQYVMHCDYPYVTQFISALEAEKNLDRAHDEILNARLDGNRNIIHAALAMLIPSSNKLDIDKDEKKSAKHVDSFLDQSSAARSMYDAQWERLITSGTRSGSMSVSQLMQLAASARGPPSALTSASDSNSVNEQMERQNAAPTDGSASAPMEVPTLTWPTESEASHDGNMPILTVSKPVYDPKERQQKIMQILQFICEHPFMTSYLLELLTSKDYNGATPFMYAVQNRLYRAAIVLFETAQRLSRATSMYEEQLMSMIYPAGASANDNPLWTVCWNDACSFTWTGNEHINQDIFECKTCGLVGTLCCCTECASVCHKGHDCKLKKTAPTAYCDCWEKCRCKALIAGSHRYRVEMLNKLITQTDLLIQPNAKGEHILLYLVKTVGRQTVEQRQCKPVAHRSKVKSSDTSEPMPEHDLEPPRFAKQALDILIDNWAAVRHALSLGNRDVYRDGLLFEDQFFLASQESCVFLDRFTYGIIVKCSSDILDRLLATLISQLLSSDEVTRTESSRYACRFVRSVVRLFVSLMSTVSTSGSKKKMQYMHGNATLKCRRVFQALLSMSIRELVEAADAIMAPVRFGIVKPCQSFPLATNNGDTTEMVEKMLAVDPLPTVLDYFGDDARHTGSSVTDDVGDDDVNRNGDSNSSDSDDDDAPNDGGLSSAVMAPRRKSNISSQMINPSERRSMSPVFEPHPLMSSTQDDSHANSTFNTTSATDDDETTNQSADDSTTTFRILDALATNTAHLADSEIFYSDPDDYSTPSEGDNETDPDASMDSENAQARRHRRRRRGDNHRRSNRDRNSNRNDEERSESDANVAIDQFDTHQQRAQGSNNAASLGTGQSDDIVGGGGSGEGRNRDSGTTHEDDDYDDDDDDEHIEDSDPSDSDNDQDESSGNNTASSSRHRHVTAESNSETESVVLTRSGRGGSLWATPASNPRVTRVLADEPSVSATLTPSSLGWAIRAQPARNTTASGVTTETSNVTTSRAAPVTTNTVGSALLKPSANTNAQKEPSIVNTSSMLARTFLLLIRQLADLIPMAYDYQALAPNLNRILVVSKQEAVDLQDFVEVRLQSTWDWLFHVLDSIEAQLRFGSALISATNNTTSNRTTFVESSSLSAAASSTTTSQQPTDSATAPDRAERTGSRMFVPRGSSLVTSILQNLEQRALVSRHQLSESESLASAARREFVDYALSLIRAHSFEHADQLPMLDMNMMRHVAYLSDAFLIYLNCLQEIPFDVPLTNSISTSDNAAVSGESSGLNVSRADFAREGLDQAGSVMMAPVDTTAMEDDSLVDQTEPVDDNYYFFKRSDSMTYPGLPERTRPFEHSIADCLPLAKRPTLLTQETGKEKCFGLKSRASKFIDYFNGGMESGRPNLANLSLSARISPEWNNGTSTTVSKQTTNSDHVMSDVTKKQMETDQKHIPEEAADLTRQQSVIKFAPVPGTSSTGRSTKVDDHSSQQSSVDVTCSIKKSHGVVGMNELGQPCSIMPELMSKQWHGHTQLLMSRWRLALTVLAKVFSDDVCQEPSSQLVLLAGFSLREQRFKKEMEKLKNGQQKDLILSVERDRNKLISQTIKQMNEFYCRRTSTGVGMPIAVHRVKVTFKDEPGEGSGVARSFYTAFAEKLPSLEGCQPPKSTQQALYNRVRSRERDRDAQHGRRRHFATWMPSLPSDERRIRLDPNAPPYHPPQGPISSASFTESHGELSSIVHSAVAAAPLSAETTSAPTPLEYFTGRASDSRQTLHHRVYSKVRSLRPVHANRITGMFLGLPMHTQLTMLAEDELMATYIEDAMIIINAIQSQASPIAPAIVISSSVSNNNLAGADMEVGNVDASSVTSTVAMTSSDTDDVAMQSPRRRQGLMRKVLSVPEDLTRGDLPSEIDDIQLFFQPAKNGFYSPVAGKGTAERLNAFRNVGRIMGICLLHNELFALPMCRHVVKYILGRQVNWFDFAFFDPQLFESLRSIVSDEGSVEDCQLTFAVDLCEEEGGGKIDLKPNGSKMEVNSSNLMEYIYLYTQCRMVESAEKCLEQLKMGVFDVLPSNALESLTAEDVRLLLNGTGSLRVGLLKSYTSFMDESNSVECEKVKFKRWFWSILDGMKDEERHDLLYFWTGSNALPSSAEGFQPLPSVMLRPADDVHLPTANTCISRLYLPLYSSKSILKTKLLLAIKARNFGFV